MVRRIYFGNNY